jgi:hypothetical protein
MRSARSLTAFYGSERARHDTKSLRVLLCCRFSDKFPSSFPCPLSSVFLVACRWIEKQKNQHFHDLKIPFFTRMTKHGVYNCSRGRGGCARDSRHVTQWPTHFDFNLFDVVFFLLLFFFLPFAQPDHNGGPPLNFFLYFVQTTQSYFWFWASKKMLHKEENQISYPSTDE